MAEISVIVPVYNSERYIKRCVDSILSQTFKDFELILLDDGSTDQSGRLCDDYAEQDSRIRVIHQKNQGQASTRNTGIRLASAEWIAFVDADDMIHPQYFEILYCGAIEKKVKISVCHVFEGENLSDDFMNKQQMHLAQYSVNEQNLWMWYFGMDEEISKFTYWIVCAKLIHKSILLKYPFTSNRIYEDNAVVFKWLYESGNIAFCDNIMYFYYVNSGGTTKKAYSLKRLDWLWAVQEQISFYKEVGFNKMDYMLRKQYIWEALREYEHITATNRDKRAAKKLRRQIILHWIQNRTKISLAYSEKMEILSRLYPKIVQRLSEIKKRIKR